MNIGGVEKSLVNLLSIIPREKYDLHVGLVHPEGALLPLLPSDVTIHHVKDIMDHWSELKEPLSVTIKKYFLTGHLIKAIYAVIIYIVCKIQGGNLHWIEYLLKDTDGINEMFDVAVAYAGPSSDIDYYVCKKIKAKIKIGWIHFDINKVGHDVRLINEIYSNYHRIMVVSDSCRHNFELSFPHFKEKLVTFHNVVSPELIRLQARNGTTFDDKSKSKKILTVGRISKEKGQMVAIDSLKILIDKGYDVSWYFIGDGNDRKLCENKAIQMGLNDHVVFLGALVNPYGFMCDCDIYVQPSRYEGYCVTILEALCFEAPIVATNFTSINEQLKGRDNCFVVGMNAEEIALGIENALKMTS